VAGGAIGSTRLVLGSLRLFDQDVTMGESQQFTVPMLSRRATPDPAAEHDFTLNQFNMTVAFDKAGFELSQIHFYTYNPAFVAALPRPLRSRMAGPARRQLLRRLSVAIGYLPSWQSPRILLRASPPTSDGVLPGLTVAGVALATGRRRMLRSVVRKVLRSASLLDLYPVLPMLRVSAAGKSYHFGGSFPHARDSDPTFTSDRLGRVGGWQQRQRYNHRGWREPDDHGRLRR
jgi:hypothetical protein